MHNVIRPLAVFALSSVFSVGVFYLVGEGEEPGRAPMEAAAASESTGYQLGKLKLLRQTLNHVSESYVDQGRVEPLRMYEAALMAVERLVPEAMFSLEGSKLTVHVGEYRNVREVGDIDTLDALRGELTRVAEEIEANLGPDDIPGAHDDIDPFALIEFAMVNGALETLDPHSLLLPPEQSRDMDVENKGEFGGLGITIVIRDGKLTVDYPLPDTPASRKGLQPDDHIARIDGESTINMSLEDAVDLLRGPPGADVTVEIVRAGLTEPLPVTLTRERIKLNPVKAFPLEGGFGYVSISTFHAQAAADLREELARLQREQDGLKGLVLDLRDNPGGYLNQAIAVADTFLRDGEIVSTRGPHDRRAKPEIAGAAGTEDMYPIVVLVNANSASASEIVAGALRNNDRAVIVGERTFGKGSVQNLHTMAYDSKLKITIAQYLTPGERSIQSIGIPADIELIPTFVESREVSEGVSEDFVRLYSRERVRRESNLDKHLEQSSAREDAASYTVRYLRKADTRRRRFDAPDLDTDYEARFARDLLQFAHSYHRGEILEAASRLVDSRAKASEKGIIDAFESLGMDWKPGPGIEAASLEVEIDLGDDGLLIAGEEEVITLVVKNTGSVPVHRLAAIASESELLAGREFYFGRLDPGQTGRFRQRVSLEDGYPTEVEPVVFTFRDGSEEAVATETALLRVQGEELPRIGWSWRIEESDDGNVQPGDEVLLHLTVRNDGKGDAPAVVARLKNRSRRSLDLLNGTLDVGRMVAEDGSDCAVVTPGVEAGRIVGDAGADDPHVLAGDAPEYADDCARLLAAGESWTGAFQLKVREALEDGYALDLSLGDSEAYDYASVVRGGFYSYYRQEETIEFPLGVVAPAVEARISPDIQITVSPEPHVRTNLVTLSGVVTDDSGVGHVVIYAGGDKVFYQGSRKGHEVKSVPFSADVELEPGKNTISILSADESGHHSTASRVVYVDDGSLQAKLIEGDPTEAEAN